MATPPILARLGAFATRTAVVDHAGAFS
jgi:malonyl-CoA/methylmalonyl-CoA synthetase